MKCKVLYLFELAKLSNIYSVQIVISVVLYLFELAKLSNDRKRFCNCMFVLYLFELAKLSNHLQKEVDHYKFCIFLN